jgi:dTDP-4-dehydrorhamnose reductase
VNVQGPRTLLVIGASGLVGAAVVRAARLAGHAVDGVSRFDPDPLRRLDLRKADSVRAAIERGPRRPDAVILCAATSSVVACEVDPTATREVNVAGTGTVVDTAAEVGARVVFISSDYVFGDGGPHTEAESPDPMNEYGRQKVQAEDLVLEHANNVVVRTSQVFGQDSRRANYVLSVVDRLRTGEAVRARADLWGTPTYVRYLAEEIVALATGEPSGLWHIAGPDFVSRFDLAQRTARAFNLDVNRVSADTTASDTVPRPFRAGLRSIRLANPPMSLDLGLAELAMLDSGGH